MKLSKALEMFVNEKRSEGVVDATVLHYYRDIGYFIEFVLDKDIELLDHSDIVEYRLHLLNKVKNDNHNFKKAGGELSKATINSYLRTLRTFLNYLYEYELIKKFKIKLLKEPKRVIDILEDHEIEDIMKMPEKGWVQQRNKLMIFMMLDSGLRRQEILHLKLNNVDLINDLIRVKDSKGAKDRNVPLGKFTKRLFMKYIRSRPFHDENVFITIHRLPMTESSMKMVLQRLKEKNGLKKFNAHFFRHTFATKFLINQIELTGVADLLQLSLILGHESTKTTRIYLHLANQYLIKTHRYGILSNVDRKSKTKF
ncbi:tyrosine-type recombinase/integrase [Fusibacter bizertensis]